MKKTGTSVDIRTIKNFPIDNPNLNVESARPKS